MRGVHSDIDDTRRSVFREVARLAYEGGDYSRVDQIPYKLVPNGSTAMRYDVFLDRAVVAARVKLALGMELHTDAPGEPLSQRIWDAATDQKYFEEPLVNIIPFACNACPEKHVRITDSCQGCVSHPCMNVCPKDAISPIATKEEKEKYKAIKKAQAEKKAAAAKAAAEAKAAEKAAKTAEAPVEETKENA